MQFVLVLNGMTQHITRFVCLLAGVALCSGTENAYAGRLLDSIRAYDLNDYGFGLAVSTEQNPYQGAKNGRIAYPYLTSFTDSTLNEGLIFVRDGDLGLRWISPGGWELGLVSRLQTLGLGNRETDELLGVTDRKWTLEAGPTVGWRGWPIHVYLKSYAEVTNRHNGRISELAILWPLQWSRGFVVPSIALSQQNSDYTAYYYSVSEAESTPTRSAYLPEEATNIGAKLRWGYRLSDEWLLSGSIGVEQLDAAITDSPIVDKDQIWSGRIGLAYNADIFQPREYDSSARSAPRVDVRMSAFQDMIDTKVVRDASNGIPGFETGIEDYLGVADEQTVVHADATFRIGHYHRLEFGYFELGRRSETTLVQDLAFGDEVFAAGTELATSAQATILRVGYAYSLIRDAQKELGIMAGIHFTDFETNFTSGSTGQTERSRYRTPLPVVGLHASIFLSDRTSIGAKLQIFRTDFDNYEGSLNYLSLDIQRRVADAVSIGLGYSYYGMKLTSSDSDANGYLNVRHQGPSAFLSIGF